MIDLDPGEIVYSQTNTMCWMNDAVEMNTNTGGGILAGIGRMFSGGSLFVTDFTARGNGHVAFAPRFPGTIMAIQTGRRPVADLPQGNVSVRGKGGDLRDRLAAARRRRAVRRPGLHLEKVTGPGTVFLDLSGEVVERDLGAGERLLVHAGHVGVMDPTIQFDIQLVPGFKNILFGGEGLFLATLTGPGHVALQSMPILNLAEEIARYLPNQHNTQPTAGNVGGTVAAARVGGILGSLLGGSRDSS